MNKQRVLVKKVAKAAIIPVYAKPGDAGFDLVSTETVLIEPGHTVAVGTGLAFALPEGYEIQIRPRSGVSAKTPLRVANSPGTIDSGYRGEVKILLHNTSEANPYRNEVFAMQIDGTMTRSPKNMKEGTILIHAGDRIAQGVLAEVPKALFEEVEELDVTERGEGGFGSTGVK